MNTQLMRILAFVTGLVLLTACGGGGGGGGETPPPPQGSGNWDTMAWDQDNWS